jgi:hypothetical protein
MTISSDQALSGARQRARRAVFPAVRRTRLRTEAARASHCLRRERTAAIVGVGIGRTPEMAKGFSATHDNRVALGRLLGGSTLSPSLCVASSIPIAASCSHLGLSKTPARTTMSHERLRTCGGESQSVPRVRRASAMRQATQNAKNDSKPTNAIISTPPAVQSSIGRTGMGDLLHCSS